MRLMNTSSSTASFPDGWSLRRFSISDVNLIEFEEGVYATNRLAHFGACLVWQTLLGRPSSLLVTYILVMNNKFSTQSGPDMTKGPGSNADGVLTELKQDGTLCILQVHLDYLLSEALGNIDDPVLEDFKGRHSSSS
jgi:hypothetical protein